METKTNPKTNNKSSIYDKRLIKQIVQEIEDGVPRKEIMEKHQCCSSSISTWMRDYGSEHYKSHLKRRFFTPLQKRSIVSSILQKRMSIEEAALQYGIKDKKLIRDWISLEQLEIGDICVEANSTMVKKKSTDTDAELIALKKALEESQLKIKALNTMIDIAEQELRVNIRKKSGAKRS